MSRFKDALKTDIKATFLNTEEFAETHDLNGAVVPCVIDGNVLQEMNGAQLIGVFQNALTIYVSADDLFAVSMVIPVVGELLSVDRSLHVVRHVAEEGGMLVIIAEEVEQ